MQIITPFQDNILKIIGSQADAREFYFIGGTALSLFYLQHRKSEDLDFFTSIENLISPFSQLLQIRFKAFGYETMIQRSFNSFAELKVTDKNGEDTLIHLALDAPFHLEPFLESSSYPGLRISSFADIAANKLLALFGRAALRDFIDVYYLIKLKKITKNDLIISARKKDPGFDLYWLGVAFERIKTYHQTDYDMSLVFDSLREDEIASFFNAWRQEIVSSLKTAPRNDTNC